MAGRRLAFVNDAIAAARVDAGTDVVILDPFWVRGPADPRRWSSVNELAAPVLEARNLVDESLACLDDWAAAAGLPEAFVLDGASWWVRVRMAVRWDLHELLLWRAILGDRLAAGTYDELTVPGDRRMLAEVARVAERRPNGPRVSVGRSRRRWSARTGFSRLPRPMQRAALAALGLRPSTRRRTATLDARVDRLLADPPRILAIAWDGAFQVVETPRGRRLMDPHLGLVLDRLREEGTRVATVGAGSEHVLGSHWAHIVADEELIPRSIIRRRWGRAADEGLDAGRAPGVLRQAGRVPLDVDGWDLAPAAVCAIEPYAGRWLAGERRAAHWAARFLGELGPRALFMDREATRTPWLAAARTRGIPVVSVQHGMIYPNTPEYAYPLNAGLLRPDITCTFGPDERDLLVADAGYGPEAVVVTGSPRTPAGGRVVPLPDAERAAIRAELGVRPDHRLLVVTVAHGFLGELYSSDMLLRLLADPPPGVHVVVKVHPQDRSHGRWADLLDGAARDAGHEPPPVTVVRDMDIFRLLAAADAHLGQHSTVLTDAVVTGVPNLVAAGIAYSDQLGYAAAGVAVAVRTPADVHAAMADLRPPTPEARAAFLAAHFRDGDATGEIARVLLAVADGRPAAALN